MVDPLVVVVSILGLPVGKLMIIRQRNCGESVQIVVERDGEPEIVKQLKALIREMTDVEYSLRPIADSVVETLQRILQQDTVPQVQIWEYSTQSFMGAIGNTLFFKRNATFLTPFFPVTLGH